MGINTSWRTNAATLAAHGLAKAVSRRFTPGPAVTEGQPAESVAAKGWNGAFALAAPFGWTFLF